MSTSFLPVLLLFLVFLIKGTLLLLAAGGACRLLRRSSAALRHTVWTAALCSVILMPLISMSLPSWDVVWMHAPEMAAVNLSPAESVQPVAPINTNAGISQHTGKSVQPVVQVQPPAMIHVAAATPSSHAQQTLSLNSMAPIGVVSIVIVWFIGFLLVALQFMVGLQRVHRISSRAVPLKGAALEMAHSAQNLLGVRHAVFLSAAKDSGFAVPMTWGLLRPTVLLPEQWTSWSPDCLRAALLHELAHVQRLDWLTQLAGRLACAVYWFHPLVWFAARCAREEGERACDDIVLSSGMTAASYAQRLVDVVRSIPEGASARTVAVAMAHPSDVEDRVRSVLAPGRDRTPRTLRKVTTVMLCLALLTLTVAVFHLTQSTRAAVSSVRATNVVRNQTVLPNGFKISLVGLTQAKQMGDKWDIFGDLWWAADGTPIMPQNGWESGHWNWDAARAHGLAPYTFKILIVPPASARVHPKPPVPASYSLYDYSFYVQFDGALNPATYSFQRTTRNSNGKFAKSSNMSGPLTDGSAPQYYESIGGLLPSELYPTGTRSCTLRCGIAQGPWQTRASYSASTISFIIQQDLEKPLSIYFPHDDSSLPNMARRCVVVETNGQVIPLSPYKLPDSTSYSIVFGGAPTATLWLPSADVLRAKAFCLQTRAFQTVEFRNVQLQPELSGANVQHTVARIAAQDTANQLDHARQLRSHLQGWAQANRTLLQEMARARPGDLTGVVQVCTSLWRLPRPLWDSDPRMTGSGDWPVLLDEIPSGMTLQHLQRTHDSVETQIRKDFAQHRDFAIAQSFSSGHPNITLWASGRITKMDPESAGNQQEVAPGYGH